MILFTDPIARDHPVPPGHPERPARYDAVMAALGPMGLETRAAPEATRAQVLRAHPAEHLDALAATVPAEGLVALDGDTVMGPASLEAARRAAGAMCAAVEAGLAGSSAFVAMRPPGHHAERTRAMGFCLLSTAAIGALHALTLVERVAVLDFDVHHGNGTQDVLWDQPNAFFASSHQMPLYPGTGAAEERGAHGQIVNAPLPPGSDGAHALSVWKDRILPAMEAHRPNLVIVSAGFDAHADDPLAQLDWQAEDFAAITEAIVGVAGRLGAPVVSTLEGGYDLDALAASVAAHVGVLR